MTIPASKASSRDLEFGLLRERIAAEVLIEQQWPDCTVRNLPNLSQLDFAIDGPTGLIGFLEVKVRRIAAGQYPTTAVGFNKHEVALALRKALRLPTYCLVVYTDKAGLFQLDERPDGKELMTRADRGHSGSEHAFYKTERMLWFNELPALVESRLPVGS